jgi:hypothetical protein
VIIGVWLVLRTRYDVESRPYVLWTVLASAVALVSPASGLVILAGTAPFYEPTTLLHLIGVRPAPQTLGLRHVFVAVIAISVVIRLVAGGWRRMPWSPAVFLGIAIAVVTAIGVVVTWARFPPDWARIASYTWLSSVGGAMLLLVAAVWVARDGTKRPIVAAIVATTVAVALSVADQLDRGIVSGSAVAWIGFWKDFGPRLGGAVPSPNGMAALSVMPFCIAVAFLVLDRRRDRSTIVLKLLAVLAVAVFAVALYLTFSRAALIATYALAVVIAWRLRRGLGLAVLVVGLVAGIALLPSYLALRGEAANAGAIEPGSVLVATDLQRLRTWNAAGHMFLDRPLTGQGFLAYKQLAPDYGDPVIGSPHNEWLRLFTEEGVVGGIIGLAFVVATLVQLTRRRGWLESGILAGTIGWMVMASFNNPLLFIQVSAVVCIPLGYGLARSVEPAEQPVAAADEGPIASPEPGPEAMPA